MRSKYAYANADIGVPECFPNLQVVSLDTGAVLGNVKEVDCVNGWAVQTVFEEQKAEEGGIISYKPSRRVLLGRFALDYIERPEQGELDI